MRTPGGSAWLFGRGPDLLFGYGLGYVLSIPLLGLVVVPQGQPLWPGWIAALLPLLISGPHYGATILRAYAKPEDRNKYLFFTLHTTLVLGVLFVAGLKLPLLGSILITLYVTWSPWHFAGQNYGIALMSLRRQGVPIPPLAKRLLYISFFCSFLLAFLEIHVSEFARNFLGVRYDAENPAFQLLRLGLPAEAGRPLTAVCAVAYAGSLLGAAALLLRGATLRQLAPAACLVLTQSLWFSVPALANNLSGTMLVATLPFSTLWVATAHSVQYLWVTAYYEQRSRPGSSGWRFLWRCLLAGSALVAVPGLLMSPPLLGSVAWDAGLGMVLFSVVNLHHFLLDGAIWKLREGRIARVLLQAEPVSARPVEPSGAPMRWLWVAVGVASLAVALHEVVEVELRYSRAGADADRARSALERLRFTGRDSPSLRLNVAQVLYSQRRFEEAELEVRRSLELGEAANAWPLLGRLLQDRGDWDGAARAYAEALAVDPDHAPALYQAARVELRRAEASPEAALRVADAEAKLVRAVELRPDHVGATLMLARLYQRTQRRADAIAVLEGALGHTTPAERPRVEAVLDEIR